MLERRHPSIQMTFRPTRCRFLSMKFLPLVILSSCSLFAVPVQAQFSEQQLMSEAQTAYIRGDLETAKKDFELVRRINPRNQIAINYLRMIMVAEAKAPHGNEMEKQLTKVIMPKVELREATLDSALDYLKQQVAKITNAQTNVSFVTQLTDEQKATQVTLSVSNIPFTEVLRYIGSLANVQFEYEKYAIRVKPANGAAPAPPAAAAPAAPTVPGL